jgi:hypothetical protein
MASSGAGGGGGGAAEEYTREEIERLEAAVHEGDVTTITLLLAHPRGLYSRAWQVWRTLLGAMKANKIEIVAFLIVIVVVVVASQTFGP